MESSCGQFTSRWYAPRGSERVRKDSESGTDGEPEVARWGLVVLARPLDVRRHLRGQRLEEALHLGRIALGDQFDAAVGLIANVAGQGMALRQVAGGVAESPALDAAGVDYAFANGHGAPRA